MGAILVYSIISSIILIALYLTYKLTMSSEKQHAFNRIVIYVIYTLSLALPAIYMNGVFASITRIFNSTPIDKAADVIIDADLIQTGMVEEQNPFSIIFLVIFLVYIIGVAFASLRFIYSLIRINRIIRNSEKSNVDGGYILARTERRDIAPFSWWKYIVIPISESEKNLNTILTHEEAHLSYKHWIDQVLGNILAIFQWYNPAAWLMIEEMKAIHEYQADEAVINSGINIKQYQYLLIEKAIGKRFPSPANSLNQSKLKYRVTMMYKSNSKAGYRWTALAAIPAIAAAFAVINVPAFAEVLSETEQASFCLPSDSKVNNNVEDLQTPLTEHTAVAAEAQTTEEVVQLSELPEVAMTPVVQYVSEESQVSETVLNEVTEDIAAPEKKDKVYMAVEKVAEYPGGQKAMMQFLVENVKYPENAMKNDIQGRVVVKFIVTKKGKIKDVTVLKPVDPELDKEAIRVVESMPDWIPAQNDGKAVDSYFHLPVSFKLRSFDEETKTEEKK